MTVLWVLLFAVLAARHSLAPGPVREAILAVLFGATLALSLYASAPWGDETAGVLPAVTVVVAAAGLAAGAAFRSALVEENTWR